jgi:hypothetical protein
MTHGSHQVIRSEGEIEVNGSMRQETKAGTLDQFPALLDVDLVPKADIELVR